MMNEKTNKGLRTGTTARSATTAAMIGAAVVCCAGTAFALTYAQSNGTYQVCAQTLYLRNAPSGPAIDTLKYGTYFKVTSSAGGNWVYGYSYWSQKYGWVQNGWFC